MDDDDDYFTPTTTASRRLAMLFGPEEMSGDGSSSSHRSPNTQFKFVAPRQQRAQNNSASSSPLSGPSQPASTDGQEVLLKVPLILLSQGTEKNGMARTQVICQMVGSTAQRSFSLVVATAGQTKREVWRAVVDSHLTLEVVEHSTVKMTSHTSEVLTLLGELQQIEAMVTQVAICQGVASSKMTQQDLHTGKGHVLTEGDVAKVSYTTYAITAGTCRGEKVHEVKGVKITVSDPATGSWDSCLAGATADSHRLIFIPRHEKGGWQPPTQYYDVKVAKVKTKGGREKAVAAVRSGSQPEQQQQQQQQQQGLTSDDASPAMQPLTITNVRTESGDSPSHSAGEEEDKTSRKAALVTRMAQVGTQIFPLLPGAKPVPQSQVKPPVAERSGTESPEGVTVSKSTPANTAPTLASAYLTTTTTASTSNSVSTPGTVSSSGSLPAHTTTPGITPGPALATHPQVPPESHGIPLAHSVTQLSTTVAKIADRVEMLLAKAERVEVKSRAEAEGGCVPETLMALANGLVEHNKTLKTQLEEAERRMGESQAAQISLLTMNTQLLEDKRELLRKEDELRKKVDEKEEELKEERNQQSETEPGLMPKEVQSLVKATLNGLFRTMASDFSEETYYSQSQVFQTLRTGFETAYSSFVEDLEKMTEGKTEQKQNEEQEEKEQEEEQEHQQQGRENEEREQEVKRGEREEMR